MDLLQTRAIRRALTKHERSVKTLRQKKRDIHLKPRVYALKA
jgi:large subunit ribosomal protein L35e